MSDSICLVIRGAVKTDDGKEVKFRPGTPSPDMHWSSILVDQYKHLNNFAIQWIDGEPMVTVTRKSYEEDETAFEHIMNFAKLHGLCVTACRVECAMCDGHKACLTEHKL